MTSHVIAYRSLELLFGTHTFNFSCFFDDFDCVFTQIRCLSRVLYYNREFFLTHQQHVLVAKKNRLIEMVLLSIPTTYVLVEN